MGVSVSERDHERVTLGKLEWEAINRNYEVLVAIAEAAERLRERVRREDRMEQELGRWTEAAEFDDAWAVWRERKEQR